MPTYDYRCPTNQRIVEVRHGMQTKITTWGELCRQADISPGDTPEDAPVEKLITGGNVVSSHSLRNPEPACGNGACGQAMPAACCGGGACSMEDF